MRASTSRDLLAAALAQASTIAQRKSTQPILACALVEAVQDGLRVTATDTEIAYTSTIEGVTDAPGALAVPCHDLSAAVRSMPGGSLTLRIVRSRLEISGGSATVRLNTLSADEFPAARPAAGAGPVRVAAGVLRRLLAQTAYSAAKEIERYGLNGLHLEPAPGRLRLVATDGHRLAWADGVTDGELAAVPGALLPIPAVKVLRAVLDGDETRPVGLEVTDGGRALRVDVAGTHLWIRLIDGQFPDYRQVVPGAASTVVRLDRKAAIDACRRLNLVTTEHAYASAWAIDGAEAVVTMETADRGRVEDRIPVELEGAPLTVGFNPDLLSEALSSLEAECVEMHLAGALAPVRLAEAGGSDTVALVMPMRLG